MATTRPRSVEPRQDGSRPSPRPPKDQHSTQTHLAFTTSRELAQLQDLSQRGQRGTCIWLSQLHSPRSRQLHMSLWNTPKFYRADSPEETRSQDLLIFFVSFCWGADPPSTKSVLKSPGNNSWRHSTNLGGQLLNAKSRGYGAGARSTRVTLVVVRDLVVLGVRRCLWKHGILKFELRSWLMQSCYLPSTEKC